MSEIILNDKESQPDNKLLKETLGKSFILWKDINKKLRAEYGILREEWKFYNVKSGWLQKLLLKKRNLFFFTPLRDHFKIVFVFGDKAVAEIEKSDLPKKIIDEVVNAKKYAEGRGLPIEVRTQMDVKIILKLVKIKVNN